jgi:hypothetical protein
MEENIKDNTYMLFSENCGATLPRSFQKKSKYLESTRVKREYQKIGYKKLNSIKVNYDRLLSEYNILYDDLKARGYEDDLSWRYIILCLHTMIKMVKDIIIDYGVLVIKNVSTPLVEVLLFPLFSISFLITSTLRAYLNGENMRDYFIKLTYAVKETITKNIVEISGILLKFYQSLTFFLMCNKLTYPDPPKKKSKEDKPPDLAKIYEKAYKIYLGTTIYVVQASKYFSSFSKDVYLFSSTIAWGSVNYVSQKAVDILKYFFNKTKEKLNIKSRGSSYIFDKFEDTINSFSSYLSDKYTEKAEKLQEIAFKVKSQFKVAKIVLDMPNLLIAFAQLIAYYGSSLWMDKLYIMSWIYEACNSLSNLEIYNISIPTIVFLISIILKLIGTCWNYVQYKTCINVKCDVIDYNIHMDMERKTCMDQCWNQGVDGITSIFVPTIVIDEIKKKYQGMQILDLLNPIIEINNSVQKGGLSIFIMKNYGVSPTIIKFNELVSSISDDSFYKSF